MRQEREKAIKRKECQDLLNEMLLSIDSNKIYKELKRIVIYSKKSNNENFDILMNICCFIVAMIVFVMYLFNNS